MAVTTNGFANDTYDTRTERLLLLSANTSGFSAALGIPTAMATQATASAGEWNTMLANANLEKGEKEVQYSIYKASLDDLRAHYQRCKEFLIDVLSATPHAEQFASEYGISGESPTNQGGVISACEAMLATNARLTTAVSPYILPAATATSLTTKLTLMRTEEDKYKLETRESLSKYHELDNLYEVQTVLLRSIYGFSTLVWGKEDPRLIELGFVTQSPSTGGPKPLAPTGLTWTAATHTLTWTEVTDATSYVVESTMDHVNWETNENHVIGNAYQFTMMPAPPVGDHAWARVWSRNGNGLSEAPSVEIEIV